MVTLLTSREEAATVIGLVMAAASPVALLPLLGTVRRSRDAA